MRPKSGLPKRRALRSVPVFQHGFRSNPATEDVRHPEMDGKPLHGGTTIVSLFAGCGGLDLGFLGGFRVLGREFESRPFQILAAIDNDERAIETYQLNIGPHGQVGDLTSIPAEQLPKASILLGGFPCQDFSSSGPKVGLAGERGQLYRVMVDYMQTHRPEIVVAENVAHLKRLHGGKYLETILQDFEACGYEFDVWELYGPDFGLPQSRRRLFLVGKREDLPGRPARPVPTHPARPVSVDVALDDLIPVTDESVTNQSQYFVATKATAGGGQGDHQNKRGEPAYCIRANAKARIQFHYELDRRLTVRECARLQSFPDEFVFPFAAMSNMTQIGNAVPPLLAHVVAGAIQEYLEEIKAGVSNRHGSRVSREMSRQIDFVEAAEG